MHIGTDNMIRKSVHVVYTIYLHDIKPQLHDIKPQLHDIKPQLHECAVCRWEGSPSATWPLAGASAGSACTTGAPSPTLLLRLTQLISFHPLPLTPLSLVLSLSVLRDSVLPSFHQSGLSRYLWIYRVLDTLTVCQFSHLSGNRGLRYIDGAAPVTYLVAELSIFGGRFDRLAKFRVGMADYATIILGPCALIQVPASLILHTSFSLGVKFTAVSVPGVLVLSILVSVLVELLSL